MKRSIRIRLTALAMAMLIWLTASADVIAAGNGSPKTTRNFANVVVFAYFQDEENKDYYNATSSVDPSMSAAEKIMEFYNGTSGRSAVNYFATISDGRFALNNLFPQWDEKSKTVDALELPFQKSQAETSNIDYNIVKYVAEHVALPEGSTVDYDNDGLADNLTIILQGGVSYNYTSTMPSLYPHQNNYPGDSTIGGEKVSSYNMLNTDRLLDSSLADQSGVICHEFLHTLGYPDLYTRDGSLPVNNWDIMGQSSRYLTRPLAYLRMAFTGWCDLPKLTESQSSVSLKVNEAVILVSPLNPYEVFVVERREQGSMTDPNSLDAAIGGSGLIVYRVDTTVEGLSNYFGKTGVYLFRPQPGQSGYVAGNERQTLNNAFLSQESGRTSIGSGDSASGLVDGALTFSDGTNSGIVITNISAASGSEMTFAVSIPDASTYDLWEDTGFPTSYDSTSLANIGGQQMAIAYTSRGTTLALYQYQNGSWNQSGLLLNDSTRIGKAVLFELDGSPAVAYSDGGGNLKFKRSTATGWSDFIAPISNISGFDIQQGTDGQTAHLCYIVDNQNAYYVSVTAQGASSPIRYTSGLLGNPKIVVTNDTIYAAAYDLNQNNIVKIYPLPVGGSAFGQAIRSPGNDSAYSLIAYDNTLYFASGSSTLLQVKRYNGTAWEEYASLATDSFTPQLAVAQGNLYLLTIPSKISAGGLWVYGVADGKLQQEGEPVDNRTCSNYTLIASQDNLFVGYTTGSQTMVKRKTTANPLVSLTITPPSQTSYLKGQSVSTAGLKVIANYASSSRELSPTEYTITNFATDTVGEKLAVISFGGKQNTFAYTVLEETAPQPTAINTVTLSGLDIPAAGAIPDTTVTAEEDAVEVASVSWSGTLDGGKFTYNQDYTVTVTLAAKSGYTFASTVAATLNGEMLQAVKNTDGTLQITRRYPGLEAPDITASPASLTLKVGESGAIAITDPTGAALRWSSKDDAIATVSQSGTVTGVAEGFTEITVTNAFGKSVVVPVTVLPSTAPQPTAIDTVTLSGLDIPAAGAIPDTTVTAAESAVEVAFVSWSGTLDGGKFTYNQDYTVTVTLAAKSGYTFASTVAATLNGEMLQAVKNTDGTLQITRRYPALEAPDITASPASLTLKVGESGAITITDPTGAALRWSSKDDAIATVSQSGTVTGVAEGFTEITVTNAFGKSVVVPVTVTVGTGSGSEQGSENAPEDSQKPDSSTPEANQNPNGNQTTGQIVSTGAADGIFWYSTVSLLCMAALAILLVLKRKKN